MKVLILGGAGKMAEAIERDLLDANLDMEGADISKLVIADMNPEAVNRRAQELESPRVSTAVVDIADHEALVSLLKGHDLVVNAALTPTTLKAVKAALEAGVNIITLVDVVVPTVTAGGAPLDDIGLPTEKFLDQLDDDFKHAGLTAVMGLGAGPGITSITGRYFVDKLETVESIDVNYAAVSLSRYILQSLQYSKTEGSSGFLDRVGGKRCFSRSLSAGLRYSACCMRNPSHSLGLSDIRG
jgi:saccharopine dehydrogenase-like NADP-dependent oxidoreductase